MKSQGKYQPLTYFQLMEVSLRELLMEKGLVTEEQLANAVEDMRRRTPERGLAHDLCSQSIVGHARAGEQGQLLAPQ